MVLVWSLDRLGRSIQNLVELPNELLSVRIDLMLLQHGMDTSNSSGCMMFSIYGTFAEFDLPTCLRHGHQANCKRCRRKDR